MFTRFVGGRLLPALVIILMGRSFAADPSWRFSNPKPHGNNIFDMGFDGQTVWQLGERGRFYTSPDLDNWFPHDAPTSRALRGITFFNGETIISGQEGIILKGRTPEDLSLIDLKTSDWLEGIAASSNMVVTVGDNGSIYSSPDGSTWTKRGSFTNWLRSVAWGGGMFVAAGETGFLATSPDGIGWTKVPSGVTANLNRANWLNDRFWVVGEAGTVLTNNARMTFSKFGVGSTNTFFAVAASTNEVVIAGDSVVQLGNLATGTWTPQADATSLNLAPLWPYYSALWDGRLFLLGGRTGMQVQGFRTNSTAELHWYTDEPPTRNWLWSVVHLAGFYTAVGAEGTIVTSLDGLEWTRESTPTNALNEILLGVAGTTNQLVAVGSGGTILWSPNIVTNSLSTNASGQVTNIQTSLFGVIWNQVTPSPITNDLQAIAANGSIFLAAGAGGTLLTSTNGIVWRKGNSGTTEYLSGATAWPGGFVCSGSGGTILYSSNGTNWNRGTTFVTEWIYAVRYVGGKLVAVGENGKILTSDDAKLWRPRTSGTTEWINDVTFASNAWYAVAGNGLILRSPDLATWTPLESRTSKSLYGAAVDGNQLIAAGLEGVIVRTRLKPSTAPVNFLSYDNRTGTGVFLFEGEPDQRFVLESLTGLDGTWQPAAHLEIVNPGGTLIYEMPNTGNSVRFFRTQLALP